MYSSSAFEGFSIVKLIIAIIIVGLISFGGYLGYSWYLNKQQMEAAVVFTNDFVANIQNQDYTASYEQLSDTAQQEIGSAASWTAWVQAIKSADVQIDEEPITTNRSATNAYTSFYLTSSEEGLSVTATKDSTGYSVTNYQIRNESDVIK